MIGKYDEVPSEDDDVSFHLLEPKTRRPDPSHLVSRFVKYWRKKTGSGAGWQYVSLMVVVLLFFWLLLLRRPTPKPWLLVRPTTPSSSLSRPLVLYTYFDTPDARANIRFFLKHGLHSRADFVFILNGRSDVNRIIPSATNIKIVQRENTCFDMGAYGEVLTKDDKALIKGYERFILMNASIRGPFIPHWASATCWSDAFLDKVNNRVKLVGMSYDCHGLHGRDPHVQSMILATDSVGLDVLMSPRCLGTCYDGWMTAVGAEIAATHLVREAGYRVDSMNTAFHREPDFADRCSDLNPTIKGQYHGGYMHPYETLFIKTKSSEGIGSFLHNLTAWHDALPYSSYDQCG